MRSIKLYSLVLAFLISVNLSPSNAEPLGTTGKIKGKVTDAKSNTAIIGAIVKVDGTNLGAESDATGDYVILNVPVGTYTVRCTYLGFGSLVQTDVRVSADVTTNLDFAMTEKITVTDTVEIIAKRNTLSPDQSGRIISEETIVNNGIRGIENIAGKTAGVVEDERGTAINIRGGRTDETAVIIDGVLTTNPLDGKNTAYVSNNLLQEMAVLTGGFSAEYGNILSGVINVTTKSGQPKYSGSAEVISDQIYSNFLNTNTQGYNLYNVNLGGPIIPTQKLKNFISFYGGVERDVFVVSSPSWIADELNLTNNIIPGYDTKRWSGNGKLNFDFSNLNKNLQLKVLGGVNISRELGRQFVQSYMLYNSHRNPQVENKNDQVYSKITHQLSSKIFYEVQFNYFKTRSVTQDPYLKDDLFGYGDPNKVHGAPAVGSRVPFDKYSLFALYNRVNNLYSKNLTQYYEGSFNVTAQVKKNEFKLGGNFKYHTVRFYQTSPVNLAPYKDSSLAFQRKIFDGAKTLSNYYGYTFNGLSEDNSKPTAGDPLSFDGAKHPIVAAAYLQDKIEFKDFTMNAGLRFDYLDPNTWRIKDITHIVRFGNPNALDPEDFDTKSDPTYAVSPRLGFSFPVTEKTIFHAQYGKFIQLPPLQYLYNGYQNLAYWVNNAGFAGSFGNPNLKPEKTTSYEIGFKQTLGDKLSFDLTAFYKETKDLIGIKKYPQLPNQIQVYANNDYGTIRGADLSVELRRTGGFAMQIAYTLSYSSGTGSNPNSASTAAWLGNEQPKFTFPLDFDQRHTGVVNMDYRLGKDNVPKGVWGAILSRLGFNLLYTFNSGRPYSKKDAAIDPFNSTGGGATLESTINGAYGPWNHRLDLKIDKTVTIWKLDFNFYTYILNVLNTELVNGVWDGSGEPGTTGYLSTENGINAANGFENPSGGTTRDQYIREYTLRSQLISNYGPPRQIRFGIKMSF